MVSGGALITLTSLVRPCLVLNIVKMTSSNLREVIDRHTQNRTGSQHYSVVTLHPTEVFILDFMVETNLCSLVRISVFAIP